jgi:hypothetical protein
VVSPSTLHVDSSNVAQRSAGFVHICRMTIVTYRHRPKRPAKPAQIEVPRIVKHTPRAGRRVPRAGDPAEVVVSGIRTSMMRKLATVGVCAIILLGGIAASASAKGGGSGGGGAASHGGHAGSSGGHPGAQQATGPRPVLSTTAPCSPALVASGESVSTHRAGKMLTCHIPLCRPSDL